jgi:hypothetical protein
LPPGKRAQGSDYQLQIGATDGSVIHPIVRELDTEGPRGRGMYLVNKIEARWGVREHRDSKQVWVEVVAEDCAPGLVGHR